MDLNLNNLSKNSLDLKISNSTIFYLYFKKYKSRTFYKSFNKIRGSYKDFVVKNTIYVSSNGLKKTGVFAKHEFNSNILQSKFDSFVCYFGLLEDNFFKFAFHSQFYLKKLRRKYLINKCLINTINKKIIKISLYPIFFQFFSNNIIFLNNKNNSYDSFTKTIIIRHWYRKLIFLTSTGRFIKVRKKNYRSKFFFGRWIRACLARRFRKRYFKIIRNRYRLLRFVAQISIIRNKDPKIICNIILYFKHLRFWIKRFNKTWKRKVWKLKNKYQPIFQTNYKPKFRRPSKAKQEKIKLFPIGWRFLYLQTIFFRIKKFLKFFYFLAIKKYLFNLTNKIWLKNLFFNKFYYIFNKDNDEIIKSKFLIEINKINIDDRFKLMSFIDLFIKIKLINFTKFSINNLASLATYYSIKSLILEQLFINSNKKYLFFKINATNDNIYDLFITKFKNVIINVYTNYRAVRYIRGLFLNKNFNSKKLKLTFLFKKKSKRYLYKFFLIHKLFFNLFKLTVINLFKFYYKTNLNKLKSRFLYNKIIFLEKKIQENKILKKKLLISNKIIRILFYLIQLNFLKFYLIIDKSKINFFIERYNNFNFFKQKYLLKKVLKALNILIYKKRKEKRKKKVINKFITRISLKSIQKKSIDKKNRQKAIDILLKQLPKSTKKNIFKKLMSTRLWLVDYKRRKIIKKRKIKNKKKLKSKKKNRASRKLIKSNIKSKILKKKKQIIKFSNITKKLKIYVYS